MKVKLTDQYPVLLSVYLSQSQINWIDKQGKRSSVIRDLIDEKMKGGK